MSDDSTVVGPDGIRRSFDEHYDTMMDVEQDPSGAHYAIQIQHARIKELEGNLKMALEALKAIARPKVGANWDWTDDEVSRWREVWYHKYGEIARNTLAAVAGAECAGCGL